MDWKEIVSSFGMQFAMALLPFIAAPLAAFVFAKARTAWAEFKAESGPAAFWLEQVARMAVLAAEQAKAGELGREKLAYAFGIVEKYLAGHGYKIDIDLIYAAIEAAVLTEFNRDRAGAKG